MMKHKINYKIRQLKVQENCVIMTSTQEEKNLYAEHRCSISTKDRCFPQHYYITLFGYSWGDIASQIQTVFIREAVTSDNRNSFFPSKNYLQKQSCQSAFGNLCPCADVTILLVHNQICH